jgi:hypothetical protein
MLIINYSIKNTSAGTDYLSLDNKDMEVIQLSIIGVLTYMNELSITRNKDVRNLVTGWFNKSDKRYHYSKKLGKYNSPQSFLAGTLNNLQFGYQQDFSLLQLQTLQDIINDCVDVIEKVEDVTNIQLQQKKLYTKIWAQENMLS